MDAADRDVSALHQADGLPLGGRPGGVGALRLGIVRIIGDDITVSLETSSDASSRIAERRPTPLVAGVLAVCVLSRS